MIGDRSACGALPGWLQRQLPAGWTRYKVRVDDQLDIVVNEVGDGSPVLLVHGNPTWGFLYRKVAAELADAGFRLIMPDLIGLGFSDKPTDGDAHTLDNHGRWLGTLVDALELGPTIFCGQDWGGPIGLLGIANRQVDVAGMVILNTVIGPPRPGFRPTFFHRLSRVPVVSDVLFRGLSFPQNVMAAVQGNKRSISIAAWRAYRYPLRDRRTNVAPLAMARMVPDSQNHPSVPALERCRDFVVGFDGPVSAVWGDRDPILGSVGRYLEKLLPDAEMTHTDAGHFLQEEVPHLIADAIVGVRERATLPKSN